MLLQLLQQRGFNPPPNPGLNNQAAAAGVAGALGAVICIGLVAIVLFLVPYIFMLVRSMQALQATSERNRTWSPGLVWLGLVPCLNVIWPLLIVTKVTEALNNEFDDRGLRSPNEHGKKVGMAFAILILVNVALSVVSNGLQAAAGGQPNGPLAAATIGVGCLSVVFGIAQLVLPIIYGIQLGNSINRLKRDDDGDDEDYDDEPRPRKSKRRKPRRDEDDEPDDDFEEFDDDNDRPRRLR